MNDNTELKAQLAKLEQEKLTQSQKRRGPGRGIGEKRISRERIDQLNTLFMVLQDIHEYLSEHGHTIINESGSLLSSQSHQDLDRLVLLIEDYLWIVNCAIAKNGGNPKLV
jgi:hypothetical protein